MSKRTWLVTGLALAVALPAVAVSGLGDGGAKQSGAPAAAAKPVVHLDGDHPTYADLDELKAAADVVLIGRVTGSTVVPGTSPGLDAAGNPIPAVPHTDHTVLVESSLKGATAGDSVVVSLLGGSTPEAEFVLDDGATVQIGTTYLFFLRRGTDEKLYPLAGSALGPRREDGSFEMSSDVMGGPALRVTAEQVAPAGGGGGGGGGGGPVVEPVPASPTPTPTVTPTVVATASTQPTPTSTGLPCTPATVQLGSSLIKATGSTTLRVLGTPGRTIDVLAYSRPSTTYRVVRSGVIGAQGFVDLAALRPATNTRLYAQQRGCTADTVTASRVLSVATSLSIRVSSVSERRFVFAGDSLPARPGGLIVSLYRRGADGREVLTAQARADAQTGEWFIDRTFTGAGRFTFVLRTGSDLRNVAGASNSLPLTIV